MRLINELFKKYKLKENTLISYGFKYENNIYSYSKIIHNGGFLLEIVIENQMINARLIDNDFNEEYTQINTDAMEGSFIANLKDECKQILIDIRNKCYELQAFIFDQSNRLAKLIKSTYDVDIEFLWDSAPGYGVFRNIRSKKWFGIIMNISKSKITKNEDDKEEIEVLNINLGDKSEASAKIPGVYSSYHMNKKNWVSIILDDTLDDDKIMELINISYDISDIKGNWLIPANPKYYDVINIFKDSDIAIWKQSNKVLPGDTVYLYVAEPYKSIMFKCIVIEADIPYEFKNSNVSMKKVMKIKLLKKYKKDEYSYSILNKYGIKAIRGPRSIPDKLDEILKKS